MKNLMMMFLSLLYLSCDSDDEKPVEGENEGMIGIKYEVSEADFINPERGFYRYTETRSGNYSVLSVNTLKSYRNETTSSGAAYATYNSLVFRYYVLENFTDSPISQEYLDNMQKDFDAAREAGVKLIPRFTYTTTANAGDCPEDFICPPYGDGPKEVVLQHIGQVAPILSQNADVILTVQMGFIGTWGENYYTDYFGDASSNGQSKLLDENWNDRIEVLNEMLRLLPEELMVQVRYPQMKQRAVYGVNARTNVAPLSPEEAFSGADKARIGFHNDCLFANGSDFGTYEDYGNSSSGRRTDIANLKNYFAEDSKYVVVGGETCSDGYSPQNDCAPAGIADTDLRKLHYTYLNADYNNDVNNDWVDGGCMEAIKKHLGYRLAIDSAFFPSKVAAGGILKVRIDIKNEGYASPVKERPVLLLLRSKETGNIKKFEFDTNIRIWHDGVKLEEEFDASDLSVGAYDVLLHLPDQHEEISDRPEFAIRLANTDLWESATGYNNLKYNLIIE